MPLSLLKSVFLIGWYRIFLGLFELLQKKKDIFNQSTRNFVQIILSVNHLFVLFCMTFTLHVITTPSSAPFLLPKLHMLIHILTYWIKIWILFLSNKANSTGLLAKTFYAGMPDQNDLPVVQVDLLYKGMILLEVTCSLDKL